MPVNIVYLIVGFNVNENKLFYPICFMDETAARTFIKVNSKSDIVYGIEKILLNKEEEGDK